MKKNTQIQKCTVAFIFDISLSSVLLVHKLKPQWQKGKTNGIGGKYEGNETAVECITRETKEESGLDIPPSEWVHIGVLHSSQWDVDVLSAIYSGDTKDAYRADYEEVEWFSMENLPENMLVNLPWLIPMCRGRLLENDRFTSFEITYP